MVRVVPDLKVPADQFADTPGRPCLVPKAVMHRTLPHEGAQLLTLLRREPRDRPPGHGGLKTAVAFQPTFPAVYGVHRDPKVIGNLLILVRSACDSFKRREAALFELSTGITDRLPSRHAPRLSMLSRDVINGEPHAVTAGVRLLTRVLPLVTASSELSRSKLCWPENL